MNRRIVQGAHQGKAAVTKQTEAFYRLCDVLCENIRMLNLKPALPAAVVLITRY
ncbi:alpha-galactosidase [Actinobacillus equuli]|nr:alpha-galactosidase [Actinobacillus equuli]